MKVPQIVPIHIRHVTDLKSLNSISLTIICNSEHLKMGLTCRSATTTLQSFVDFCFRTRFTSRNHWLKTMWHQRSVVRRADQPRKPMRMVVRSWWTRFCHRFRHCMTVERQLKLGAGILWGNFTDHFFFKNCTIRIQLFQHFLSRKSH